MMTDLADSSAEIVLCHTEIEELRATNAALLEVVRDCVNFLADLNTTAPTDRAKALHKRAYTAHSKAKEK